MVLLIMSSLRKFGATFEGSLDEAYLGLDKNKFHRAARWEAGKTFIGCSIISAILVAMKGASYLPVCIVVTLVISAITYYWTRYMVLEWRHDRLRAFCKKRAEASEDEVVSLNEATFIKFIKDTPLGRKVLEKAYRNQEHKLDDIFEEIDKDGDEQITARQIHRHMNAKAKKEISRDDIRRELTHSEFATSKCMRKKAVEEQQLRQTQTDSGGRGRGNQGQAMSDVFTGAMVGLDIINMLSNDD